MQVQFLEEGERLVARPQGRMEAGDGADFASSVLQRLRAGATSVTIDLDELDIIDLGGVRAILRLARSLKGVNQALDFSGGSHGVREALHQAGINHFYRFTPAF